MNLTYQGSLEQLREAGFAVDDTGDGEEGLWFATSGNYDVIILDGATEVTPTGLYEQLAEGGRLVGVFAIEKPPRATIVTRSHGDLGSRALFDAWAPVLPGLERLPAFVF